MNILREKQLTSDILLQIVQGDITGENVGAIVNAANENLRHGGGVAGAISRKGGPVIQKESDAIGFVPTGAAAVTSGGALGAEYVIHAVGPIWHDGTRDEERLLASAIRSALECANEINVRSIAFPAISSGIFGFPRRRCAEIFLETIRMFVGTTRTSLRVIRCTNIDSETANIFAETLDQSPIP